MEKKYKVVLSFETIAIDEDEAYGNAWEVVHDIYKLTDVDLEIDKIERVE